jgi:xylulokinase
MLVLGIETGIQGTRGIVLDLEAAAVVFDDHEGLPLLDGLPDGHREQDPAQWISSSDRMVRRCLAALGERRGDLLAIGVVGPSAGLVVLDAENRIVRPAKVAGDRASWRQAEAMLRAFGGNPGLLELTGNGLLPSHAGPGILWLKQHEPYHFQRAVSLMLPHDFVGYWLTAVRRCGYGSASVTGLFDVPRCEWCRELIDWLDPRLAEMLPPAAPDIEPQGVLRPELAQAWGLGSDVLVAAGLPETLATVTGAGCVEPGDLMVSLAAGAELACVSAAPTVDTRGEVAALCDASGTWLAALSMTSGVTLPDLLRRQYGWSEAEFENLVAAAPPGAGGLLCLPYLEGERTPALAEGCVGITGRRSGRR